ncbi:MAG: glycosyltransferase family 4 protein [Kiritimatiellae bacterium]|nr:glycosyltransferase family 4 protein [Kiritimatiellia bacterium]
MRVLVLTERYYPEEFLVNDLVAEWKRQGMDVEVLTQVPSYPHDRIFAGYKNKGRQTTEDAAGVAVHRVKTVLGYNRSVFRKVFNYISFAWRTSWWCLLRGRSYDRVFVYHTGPLTMASAVVVLHYLWKQRCVIWTQDLWPDAVFAYGFKRSVCREWLLNAFVRLIYSACEELLVSCPGFVEPLQKRLGRTVEFVPQWDTGSEEVPEKEPDGKVVFMFAGNLGVPQNIEQVIRGFHQAGLTAAELHFVGGGVMLEPMRALVANSAIPDVIFHGRQPRESMPAFFAKADVLVLSLDAPFSLTLPGKFQAYLKSGRPIFGILKGAAADMIEKHGLGATADPESSESIVEGFHALHVKASNGDLSACRKECLAFSETMFKRDRLIAKLAYRIGS